MARRTIVGSRRMYKFQLLHEIFDEADISRNPNFPTITHGYFALMGGYAIHVKENDGDDNATSCIRLEPPGPF
jgi:hypothetical protein